MKHKPVPRTYRISTQINEEYGLRLEKLQSSIRTTSGKKSKIGELLELAIVRLEKDNDENNMYIER